MSVEELRKNINGKIDTWPLYANIDDFSVLDRIINEINEVIFTFPHQVLVVKIRIIKRSFKGYI